MHPIDQLLQTFTILKYDKLIIIVIVTTSQVFSQVRTFLVNADSVTRNIVNIYDRRMCVVTEFTIIIGYLQTFSLTIITDFSRKWPTIYDNH